MMSPGRQLTTQAISLPFHLLWRLDTLLFNLGVTLILSSLYFNSGPIIEPDHALYPPPPVPPPPAKHVADRSSRFLWLAWVLVVLLHVCVSLMWKFVGRLGIGAVTWAVSVFDPDMNKLMEIYRV